MMFISMFVFCGVDEEGNLANSLGDLKWNWFLFVLVVLMSYALGHGYYEGTTGCGVGKTHCQKQQVIHLRIL
jgi:hypothetical protein